MTDKRREVEELREEIGKIDVQLLSSLERRGKLSKRIGELRRAMTFPPALPDRGQVEQLVAKSPGDIPHAALRTIFREIFAACFALEGRASLRRRKLVELLPDACVAARGGLAQRIERDARDPHCRHANVNDSPQGHRRQSRCRRVADARPRASRFRSPANRRTVRSE